MIIAENFCSGITIVKCLIAIVDAPQQDAHVAIAAGR